MAEGDDKIMRALRLLMAEGGAAGLPPREPRPDLHADHDRRLSRLENRVDRVVELVEKLATVDERVAEIEAGRREDRAYRKAREQRGDNVWKAIAAAPGVLAVLAVFWVIGKQMAGG